jgi:hypothetical protein
MCAICTTVIDRCIVVVGVGGNGLMLMIAAVLASRGVVMCTAMVPANAGTGRPRRRTAT